MSLRPPVDRDRLEAFLRALGERAPRGTRLYLHGGALALLAGTRAATVDVDYEVHLPPGEEARWQAVLRGVTESLQVNAEPEGPGVFMPLPAGWEARCTSVGRYGGVFAFDPYATALAKLARGIRVDLADVRALIAAGRVDPVRLRAMAREIAPRWDERTGRQPAERFLAKVDAFLAAIEAGGPEGEASRQAPTEGAPGGPPS